MRKICVITGTRAEYGLLYWVMKSIESQSDLTITIDSHWYAFISRIWLNI